MKQISEMKQGYSRTAMMALLITLPLFQGCAQDEVDSDDQTQNIPVVEVVEAEISQQTQLVTYTGTLEAMHTINVASNSPGRIDRLYVEEGDRVETGDPLILMEDNQLRQARIAFDTAQREYERLQPLYEEGAVTRQQLDMAETEFENARINLDILEENTALHSRIDGIVTEKWFEEGEIYSAVPGESGTPAIIQVMQLNPLKLIVNVNESMRRFIEVGQAVRMTVDALPDDVFESEISRIFPTVDPVTRSFRVEVLVSNEEMRLSPGMFARVTIETQTYEGLFVPREALLRGTSANTQDVLFLVNENSIAVRQVVSVENFLNDQVRISEGVAPGQHVVIRGKQRLIDGTEVDSRIYTP